jgi:hypothetical protein
MEREDSLPRSQVPATDPYPEPDVSSPSCVTVREKLSFNGRELLAPRPTPKLQNLKELGRVCFYSF